MSSKRELVLAALFTRLKTGTVEVLRNAVTPQEVAASGLIVLHDGDPGAAEVTLSPPRWHYEHRAELNVFPGPGGDVDAKFDSIACAIGTLIAANRTLGGLCDWAEAEAPVVGELPLEGAAAVKAAVITVVLHYSTTDPLN